MDILVAIETIGAVSCWRAPVAGGVEDAQRVLGSLVELTPEVLTRLG